MTRKLFVFSFLLIFLLSVNTLFAQISFKIATWNAEWLSCTDEGFGPENDELQIRNVATVIAAMDADVVALQEVGTSSSYATIDTLVSLLGEAWGGSIAAHDYSNCGQNQAIIYKKSKIQLVNASLITNGGSYYNWSSGRYPALYNLLLLTGENPVPVSLINIHAKASSDASSYERRQGASTGLKALLDGSDFNTKAIILTGDYNDYLTGTQCHSCGSESPYKNFTDDTENYMGLTYGLISPGYNNPLIDNIIISDELFNSYVSNSVKLETAATQSVNNYAYTTSDHTPVSISLEPEGNGSSGEENCAVNYQETFAASLGEFTQYSVTGDQYWYWRDIYGACMSGYLNYANTENEDWLISPPFNLGGHNAATLSFRHALNYCPDENARIANHTLWISSGYTPGESPASATWTQIDIPTLPSGTDWTFMESGAISFPQNLLTDNLRFAFRYLSDTNTASTWEIKDLAFDSECTASGTAKPTGISGRVNISVSTRKIIIDNPQPQIVAVYDITGNLIFSAPPAGKVEVPVDRAGIYIIRTGRQMHKTAVW